MSIEAQAVFSVSMQAANEWGFTDNWNNICCRCFCLNYHVNSPYNPDNSRIETRTDKKRTTYERIFSLNYIDYILKFANLNRDEFMGTLGAVFIAIWLLSQFSRQHNPLNTPQKTQHKKYKHRTQP